MMPNSTIGGSVTMDRNGRSRSPKYALEDLIKQKHDDTESYEQFLKNAEALAKKLGTGKGENDVPAALHGNREATVLYNNLPAVLAASVPPNTVAHPEPDVRRRVPAPGFASWTRQSETRPRRLER